MPNVVAKKPVRQHLQEIKRELEDQLAEVNAALAFVETNPSAADALIGVALKRGIRNKE